jgi:4-hydroxybenzoate polyprenyltransferase
MAHLGTYLEAAMAFVAFGCLASAGYVVNDLLDLSADRAHRGKRRRPFAAGDLPVAHGAVAVLLLVGAAIAVGQALPVVFALMCGLYFAGTLTYSFVLKRVPLLDVLALAGLFTLRVYAGSILLPVPASFWLLTFSMFLFLSLALVKRYTELAELAGQVEATIQGRGYTVQELPLLLAVGGASAVAAAVILVIYLIDEKFPSGLYSQPEWLWLIFPILLYWLLRVWHLAVRGRMHGDPVLFALKDRLSLALGVVVLLVLFLAW